MMTATYEGSLYDHWFVVRDESGRIIAKRKLWHPEVVRK